MSRLTQVQYEQVASACAELFRAGDSVSFAKGVFNRSSQHLNHGGVYGATRRVDAEVDGARCNALARCAVNSV